MVYESFSCKLSVFLYFIWLFIIVKLCLRGESMGSYAKKNRNKLMVIIISSVVVLFFLIVTILQIYFSSKQSKMANATISNLKENTNLIEKVYLDWWDSSLNKISSQGIKDVYEIKNTYENLNIIVKDTNLIRKMGEAFLKFLLKNLAMDKVEI